MGADKTLLENKTQLDQLAQELAIVSQLLLNTGNTFQPEVINVDNDMANLADDEVEVVDPLAPIF